MSKSKLRIQQPIVHKNYVRIADKITRVLSKKAGKIEDLSVLDWGAQTGVVSSLLLDRGFYDITLYDVGYEPDTSRFKNLETVRKKYGGDPVEIPFPDNSFDVVLSVGVLEHVPFPHSSLEEIHRILKPDGRLLVFHFPQKWSITEFIASFHSASGHVRKLSVRELYILLTLNGFEPLKFWKFNFLPKTLYGLPVWIVSIYSFLTPVIYALDHFVSRIPLLNLFCNSIEVDCIKREAFG